MIFGWSVAQEMRWVISMRSVVLFLLLAIALVPSGGAAQPTFTPRGKVISQLGYGTPADHWNCLPASMAMAARHFGRRADWDDARLVAHFSDLGRALNRGVPGGEWVGLAADLALKAERLAGAFDQSRSLLHLRQGGFLIVGVDPTVMNINRFNMHLLNDEAFVHQNGGTRGHVVAVGKGVQEPFTVYDPGQPSGSYGRQTSGRHIETAVRVSNYGETLFLSAP
jgi:hypothetical protein